MDIINDYAKLEEVKEKAIRISQKLKFKNSISGKTYNLDPKVFSPAYMLRYAVKGNVLSFIDDKMQWYFTPYSKDVEQTLKDIGFVRADFFVPCADNHTYPIQEKITWDTLLSQVTCF